MVLLLLEFTKSVVVQANIKPVQVSHMRDEKLLIDSWWWCCGLQKCIVSIGIIILEVFSILDTGIFFMEQSLCWFKILFVHPSQWYWSFQKIHYVLIYSHFMTSKAVFYLQVILLVSVVVSHISVVVFFICSLGRFQCSLKLHIDKCPIGSLLLIWYRQYCL